MDIRIAKIVAYTLLFVAAPAYGQSGDWAVWVNTSQQPHGITVAPPNALLAPWALESAAFANNTDAWKRACWLTKNGGLYGQKYEAQQILSGEISCDSNCNCGI